MNFIFIRGLWNDRLMITYIYYVIFPILVKMHIELGMKPLLSLSNHAYISALEDQVLKTGSKGLFLINMFSLITKVVFYFRFKLCAKSMVQFFSWRLCSLFYHLIKVNEHFLFVTSLQFILLSNKSKKKNRDVFAVYLII